MTFSEDRLRNLAEKLRALHAEPSSAEELSRLLDGAEERLRDASIGRLGASSRFTLAYEASHGLALVALRAKGYRPVDGKGHRKVAFEVLDVTCGAPKPLAAALSRYHDRRNRITYDGIHLASEQEARDLVKQVAELRDLVAPLVRSILKKLESA